MNRRTFFRTMLATACTAVARAYVPAALATPSLPELMDGRRLYVVDWTEAWTDQVCYGHSTMWMPTSVYEQWEARAAQDAPYCNSISKECVDALREAFCGSPKPNRWQRRQRRLAESALAKR